MAGPGLMPMELWEACPGRRRLYPSPATGSQDTLEGAPSLPMGPDLAGHLAPAPCS